MEVQLKPRWWQEVEVQLKPRWWQEVEVQLKPRWWQEVEVQLKDEVQVSHCMTSGRSHYLLHPPTSSSPTSIFILFLLLQPSPLSIPHFFSILPPLSKPKTPTWQNGTACQPTRAGDGQEGDFSLSKDLRCRLIRNTVTSMIAIKRATEDDFNYPCNRELTVMAKRIIGYYPMLKDISANSGAEWESLKKQLLKRVQNVTTPKKQQGATPLRKKTRRLSFQTRQESSTDKTDESTTSTMISERSTPPRCSTPEVEQSETSDSLQSQARHYKTLQDMYKKQARPNKKDVAQLLDLEFQSRRAFIDSDVTKEQDRPVKILEAYPCFGELDHFYGVFKKIMRPPLLDKVKHSIDLMKALPTMFPSPVAPPKKLGHVSEALLHILEEQTEKMIKMRCQNEILFTGAKHSATVGWRIILEKMGLGGKVQPHQAKKKWDSLKKKYKDCKYPGTGEGTSGKPTAANWPWFVLMDEALGQRPSIAPPVLIASIPEDTPGPSAVQGDQQGGEDEEEEEEEEEESQPGPKRKRRREDDLLSLMKEDMKMQREAEERREKESKERMERLFSLLEKIPTEDPNTFLQTRPLSSPVIVVCETNCILAIGTLPVLIYPKEDIESSVMYLMARYYIFHLTYPKCIATLLSVLQTEVLLDAIHDQDMTSSYKKAIGEWKKFLA
ncbi:hypothetical protein N1851_018650 [Merluccius polli]|uniref:Myb/SANT-like DNA-binding domain-containing protein n=1 Tax=Merluccius polli TaxID=89951 RepID=A0AA47MN99_MERPO|nr:hypothetical protein N1851_018650 [Merluccius polli]